MPGDAAPWAALPADTWHSYQQALQGSGIALLPMETNLVDQVWGNQRPPSPSSYIYSLPEEFTGIPPVHLRPVREGPCAEPPPTPGSSWQEKVAAIRQQMEEHMQSPTALLLSGLEETACE